MTNHALRKTHPMVLTAAVAVTVFSIIGSAAITGLIPSAYSSHAENIHALSANETSFTAEPRKNETLRPSTTDRGNAKAARTTPPASSHAAARDKPSLANQDAKPITACSTCGVIESIRTVEHEGDGSGMGAVAGGVVGGIAGNQVGKGKGNTLMTLLGLGGGAYAGHAIEKNMKSSTAFVVKVRMEDGSYRKVTQPNQPEYAVGDHVRVAHGSLTAT